MSNQPTIADILPYVFALVTAFIAWFTTRNKISEVRATTNSKIAEMKTTAETDAQTKINAAFTDQEKERKELAAQLTAAKDDANAYSLQLVDALHKAELQTERQQSHEKLIAGLERQLQTYASVNATSQTQINALTALTTDLHERLKTALDELIAVKERAERAESELSTERRRADDEAAQRALLESRIGELETKAARVPELEEQVKRLQGTIDAMRLEKENAHVPSAISDPVGAAAPVAPADAGTGSDAGSRDEQPVADPERAGIAEPTTGG